MHSVTLQHENKDAQEKQGECCNTRLFQEYFRFGSHDGTAESEQV